MAIVTPSAIKPSAIKSQPQRIFLLLCFSKHRRQPIQFAKGLDVPIWNLPLSPEIITVWRSNKTQMNPTSGGSRRSSGICFGLSFDPDIIGHH